MSNLWDTIWTFIYSNQLPICIGLAVVIFLWLARDRRRQKQWREEREAKMAATKARIAAKKRGE